jgi:RHS repeat-associated protein
LNFEADVDGIIQIVALEADPILNEKWYRYDAAGSLEGETVLVDGADPTERFYSNNDNSHLEEAVLAGGISESYAYDHLNRRVVKQGLDTVVYHYDLQGNLIGESDANGEILREWVYVNGQRLAMILPAEGGGGGGCESPSAPSFPSCSSLATRQGNDAGAGAFLLLLGPAFIAVGLKLGRRKYVITGCILIGTVLFFLLMPEAGSQTVSEQIYYYHNDHLGTPRVLTDSTGAVVWDVDYTPFGEIANYVTNTLPVDQPFRFPGQYNDSMTGLYYNWNRYYMPETGRYNRVDPLVTESIPFHKSFAKIFSLKCNSKYNLQLKYHYQYNNSYNYSDNNPLLYFDFNGQDTCTGERTIWINFICNNEKILESKCPPDPYVNCKCKITSTICMNLLDEKGPIPAGVLTCFYSCEGEKCCCDLPVS